ncbi:MAG: hypothetical protein WC967_03815 [Balneolaceae bacterium]
MRVSLQYIFITFIALFVVTSTTAQQSDFEIKQEFENRYASIDSSITNADNIRKIDSVLLEIDKLALDFMNNASLLDDALYPKSYSTAIAELKENSRNAEHKLLIIENQAERLSILSNEVSQYKSEIGSLVKRSDSLRLAIANSQDSERKLSNLVADYRKSVEQRDEFIFDIVDTLFVTYKALNPNAVRELARQGNKGSISDNESPLAVISSIINQNIETLQVNDESLTTDDYLRMYALQKKVSNVWNQVGDNLVNIYGGSKKEAWKQDITADLDKWRASSSYAMWTSLGDYMEHQNVSLAAFDNNNSFFAALDSFVVSATKESGDTILKNDSYKEFKSFKEMWSAKIKNDWNKYLIEGDVLTIPQMASIDSKLNDWGDESRPISTGFLILLGFSLIVLTLLIITIIWRRTGVKE